MSTHSAGPWGASAALSSDMYHVRYISDADGNLIARVSSGFSHYNPDAFGQDTALANARLIASAPELLAALKNLVDAAEDGRVSFADIAAGVDAIAKATGG